jgi:hypothetical protein
MDYLETALYLTLYLLLIMKHMALDMIKKKKRFYEQFYSQPDNHAASSSWTREGQVLAKY